MIFTLKFAKLFCACSLLATLGIPIAALGQGTMFTYQGRLGAGGAPANGIYDFQFTLYDSNSPGNVIAGPMTNVAVGVSNGLFTTALDFGNVFAGEGRSLEIGVRTNGDTGGFSILSPRQTISATPYAITAANVAGVISNASLPVNPVFAGTIAGNGGGLTNINAGKLTGTVPASQLPANVALVDASQNFLGINQFSSLLYANNGVLARGGPPGPFGNNRNGYAFFGIGDNDSGMFSSANGQIEFYNNSAEIMRISQGYVGIGSTNPIAPLTITGNNAFPQVAIVAPTNAPYGTFLSLDSSTVTNGHNYYIFSTGNVAGEGAGKLIFQDHSAGIDPLVLTSNGNVGMGTIFPTSRLSLGDDNGNNKLAIWDGGNSNNVMGLGVGPGQFRLHLPNAQNHFSFLDNPGGSNELVTIQGAGNVGIGTNNPQAKLHVAGTTILGSGNGTSRAPDLGLIIRRIVSLGTTNGLSVPGEIVARTDKIILQRDGTTAGWQIVNLPNPDNTTVIATGLTASGTQVIVVKPIYDTAVSGTNVLFSDVQNIVHFDCTFGNTYNAHHLTEVHLSRLSGDYYWVGTMTSTYDQ